MFDKLARPLVRHVLLPVPTATTKGVLVAPTVFGNVMLGPTADDIDDSTATGSTRDGMDRLLAQGRRILPGARSTRRSPRSTPACGRPPSTATTASSSTPSSATCASAASARPGSPRRWPSPRRPLALLAAPGSTGTAKAPTSWSPCGSRTSARPAARPWQAGRAHRVPLRAGDRGRDRRRSATPLVPAARPRRGAPAHARPPRPVPGLLLLGRRRAAGRRRARASLGGGAAAEPDVTGADERRRAGGRRRARRAGGRHRAPPAAARPRGGGRARARAGGIPRHTEHTGFGLRTCTAHWTARPTPRPLVGRCPPGRGRAPHAHAPAVDVARRAPWAGSTPTTVCVDGPRPGRRARHRHAGAAPSRPPGPRRPAGRGATPRPRCSSWSCAASPSAAAP